MDKARAKIVHPIRFRLLIIGTDPIPVLNKQIKAITTFLTFQ